MASFTSLLSIIPCLLRNSLRYDPNRVGVAPNDLPSECRRLVGWVRTKETNVIMGVSGMNRTVKAVCFGFAIAAALSFSAITGPASAAGGKEAIEKRIALMKGGVLKNFLYIKKYVKEGKGTPAGVAAHAHLLNDASKQVVALFPKGTGRGDYDDKTTRSLPKIWEDWAGFQKAADTLTAESAKMAEVAAGGDKDAIAAQFGMLGKNGCGGCHKPFRGAKAK